MTATLEQATKLGLREEEFEKIFGSDIEDIFPKEYLVYIDFLNNRYLFQPFHQN